jgi:urease accessory protein
LHHLGAAVTSAAVRLLGLDPIELAGVQARAARRVDEGREEWAGWTTCPIADLPADGGTLTEVFGERHGGLDARMFIA